MSSSSSSPALGSAQNPLIGANGLPLKARDAPQKHVPVFPPAARLFHLATEDPEKIDSAPVSYEKLTLRWEMPVFDTKIARETPETFEINGYRNAGTKFEARTLKQQLIGRILTRWWYVFPQWPPREGAGTGFGEDGAGFTFPYKQLLKDGRTPQGRKFQRHDIKDYAHVLWKDPETQLYKCWEKGEYPGFFVTDRPTDENEALDGLERWMDSNSADHILMDMRPVESSPSYATLWRKPVSFLIQYLFRAIHNQREIVNGLLAAAEENKNKSMVQVYQKKLKDLKKDEAEVSASLGGISMADADGSKTAGIADASKIEAHLKKIGGKLIADLMNLEDPDKGTVKSTEKGVAGKSADGKDTIGESEPRKGLNDRILLSRPISKGEEQMVRVQDFPIMYKTGRKYGPNDPEVKLGEPAGDGEKEDIVIRNPVLDDRTLNDAERHQRTILVAGDEHLKGTANWRQKDTIRMPEMIKNGPKRPKYIKKQVGEEEIKIKSREMVVAPVLKVRKDKETELGKKVAEVKNQLEGFEHPVAGFRIKDFNDWRASMAAKKGDVESFERLRKEEEKKAAEEGRMRKQMQGLMAKQRGSGETDKAMQG